jgi:hypothetical protein
MNVFILNPNPQIAAQYHCDQHLHKMILESAQMLSTAAHARFPELRSIVYRPAYPNHPCTIWVNQSIDNMLWVCELAKELEIIRDELGYAPHSASHVVKHIHDFLTTEYPIASHLTVRSFAFAGPAFIKLRNDLSIIEKYQLYYEYKHRQWVLDKGQGMTYNGRLVPEFMLSVHSTRSRI